MSTRSAASTSRMRARARVDRAEVAAERVARELGDLAGHLDAGRAGADDDEGEPGRAPLGVGLDLGGLERARGGGCGRRARSRATSPRARARASRRGRSTSSASRRRRSACRTGAPSARARRRPTQAEHSRASRSKSATSASSDADVACPLEDRAQRIRDLAGRERAGRHLVGQRLEEVEVPPVDERHLDRRPPQLQRGLEPAEAAADHDHAVGAALAPLSGSRQPVL